MSSKKSRIVNNLSDFLSVLERCFPLPKDMKGFFWFRGQTDKDFDLIPSAFRPPAPGSELAMFRQFQNTARHYKNEGTISDIYFLAQHHQLPTRLLDWSINPLVALFFSCVGTPEKDGAVYILEQDLRFDGKFPSILDTKKFDKKLLQLLGSDKGKKTAKVYFLSPTCSGFDRIYRQKGMFAYFSGQTFKKCKKPYKKLLEKTIKRDIFMIEIPAKRKGHILNQLRQVNITLESIYGDLDNATTEIKSCFSIGNQVPPPEGPYIPTSNLTSHISQFLLKTKMALLEICSLEKVETECGSEEDQWKLLLRNLEDIHFPVLIPPWFQDKISAAVTIDGITPSNKAKDKANSAQSISNFLDAIKKGLEKIMLEKKPPKPATISEKRLQKLNPAAKSRLTTDNKTSAEAVTRQMMTNPDSVEK